MKRAAMEEQENDPDMDDNVLDTFSRHGSKLVK